MNWRISCMENRPERQSEARGESRKKDSPPQAANGEVSHRGLQRAEEGKQDRKKSRLHCRPFWDIVSPPLIRLHYLKGNASRRSHTRLSPGYFMPAEFAAHYRVCSLRGDGD